MATDGQKQSRGRRWRRIAIRLAATGLVLAVLAGLCLWLARRRLAEGIAKGELRKLGAGDLTFRVVGLGQSETRLADLRVPDGAAGVDSVVVTYSLAGLRRLELAGVEVHGIDLPVCRDEKGWRVPLVDWIGRLTLPASDPDRPPSFVARVPSVRLGGVLRLVHSSLGEWRLPLRAELAVAPERLSLSGALDVLGEEQALAGELTPELDGELRLTAKASNLAGLHTVCRYLNLTLPFDLLPGGGGATVKLVVALSRGKVAAVSAELVGEQVRLRWRDQSFAAGSVHVKAHSADLEAWEVEGTVVGLGGMGVAVPELSFAATGGAAAGTLTVRSASLRRGNLAAELAGSVAWTEGDRFDGNLHISRLALGDVTVEGVRVAAKGSLGRMEWSLAWEGETGACGLRALGVSGTASLTGAQKTTLSGAATVSLAEGGERAGVPGCSGEATLRVLPETVLSLGSEGVVWTGGVEMACSELRFLRDGLQLAASGVGVEVRGEGTKAATDLAVRAKVLAGRASRADREVRVNGLAVSFQAEKMAMTDLLAAAGKPFGDERVPLVVTVDAEEVTADLAQWAGALGMEGRLTGALALTGVAVKRDWREGETPLSGRLAAACPALEVGLPGGRVLRLPTAFQTSVSGTAECLSGSLSCGGEGVQLSSGGRVAKAAAWHLSMTASDLPTSGCAELVERVRTRRGVGSGELRAEASLAGVAADLADWVAPPAGGSLAGEGVLKEASVRLVLDTAGLSGTAKLAGRAKDLSLGLPGGGTATGEADFAVSLAGDREALSGDVRLGLASPRWERGGDLLSAKRIGVRADWSGLSPELALAVLHQPLTARAPQSAARGSLTVSLDGGEAKTGAGLVATGVSLAESRLDWTGSEGWRSAAEGVCLRVGRMDASGFLMQDMGAKLSLAGERIDLSADLPLAGPGVTATVRGGGTLAPWPSLDLSLAVPEFPMLSDQGWAMGLADTGGISLSAKVSATAALAVRGSEMGLSVGLGVAEGRIAFPDNGGEVTGIQTELALDVLPETRTCKAQRLGFASAQVGRLSLGEGTVRYRIDGPRDLFVEQARVGWSGGFLETYALRFDATKSDIRGVVYARDVDVGQFIELFPGIEGTGEGRLYGRLPVFRRGGKLGYRKGFLYSTPGDEGRLKLSNLGILSGPLAQRGRTGEIVAGSLHDFAYSLFRVDIRPKGSENAGVYLRIVGAKADQTDAEPVHVDVNVPGAMEDILNLGVKVGGLGKMTKNMDTLRRFVRRLAE